MFGAAGEGEKRYAKNVWLHCIEPGGNVRWREEGEQVWVGHDMNAVPSETS